MIVMITMLRTTAPSYSGPTGGRTATTTQLATGGIRWNSARCTRWKATHIGPMQPSPATVASSGGTEVEAWDLGVGRPDRQEEDEAEEQVAPGHRHGEAGQRVAVLRRVDGRDVAVDAPDAPVVTEHPVQEPPHSHPLRRPRACAASLPHAGTERRRM